MADQKTRPDTGSVADFLAQLDDPAKRADSETLIGLFRDVSGEEPSLWGTMIGFGQYHYRYESGHEGDAMIIGFAPRKAEFSIYLMGSYLPEAADQRDLLLTRLGKHRMGKACLYVKRLSDIDLEILRELATLSVKTIKAAYPTA